MPGVGACEEARPNKPPASPRSRLAMAARWEQVSDGGDCVGWEEADWDLRDRDIPAYTLEPLSRDPLSTSYQYRTNLSMKYKKSLEMNK